MLVIKKLFSGNYLKKLHLIKNNNKEENQQDIDELNKEKINIEEQFSQKSYLISIYESSIDISICEFDKIINQYIQTPLIHQSFFFIIFDSGVIDNKIVLLTSLGLFIYGFDGNKLNLLYNDIFNTKCEPKDILMYLKINEKIQIITVYSNTNLFFLFYYNKQTKKFQKVNQEQKLCNGFIKKINIYDIKEDNAFFILSIQTKLYQKINIENYIYKFDTENNIINEISLEKNENNILHVIKNIKYIKNSFEHINNNYNNDKINDIIFDLYEKYVFLLKEDGFIILKRKKLENEEIEILDFKQKYEYKHKANIKKSFFIDYQKTNDFHLLFFDNKIKIYEEKNDVLSKIKLIPKENKILLTNSNVIIQNVNKNELSFIFYNYKNDISFINLIKEENDDFENNIIIENKYQIKVITRITNESMFCLDGAIIKDNKDIMQIYAICGLQGQSRLIKYSNILTEINLFSKNIDKEINSLILVTDNFKNNYFSNLLMTTNKIKSNLYILNHSFMPTYLKEFSSSIIKIYPVINSPNIYTLVFKNGISQIIFNDSYNFNNNQIQNIFQCDNNENNNISIIFSYNFIYEQINYVVIYLTNKHMICYNVNNLSQLFNIELENLPQLSSLGVIVIENLKKFGFIFGNYLNNHIMIIYYDIQEKKFDMKKISETKILDSQGKYLLVPEDILIYKYYIFITTHTGDFIILYFNDKNLDASLDVIFNLENITKNHSPLKFSQIGLNNNEFNIDFYSLKNAYNIKFNINRNNNNEIKCNFSKLNRYYFSKKKDLNLICFKKIYSEQRNKTNVHLYLRKGEINFSYFHENINDNLLNKSREDILDKITGSSGQIQKNNISIETIYKFPSNEKAIKIITLNEEDNELLILTNNSNLYLFNSIEEIKIKPIKKISDDIKHPELTIKGIKNYIIKEDDNGNETNINVVIAFGGVKSEENSDKKGVLIIYQYIKSLENEDVILKPIRVISGYPQNIIDAALIKNYIICSIEYALCIKEYNIKDNEFLWKSEAQAKIITYMNKSINLVPLNKFCNNYYLLTGDAYESFHLIKFSSINPANYDTLGADLSLNSLANIYPINNNSNEVFITDKKGIISKFYLNDEIYNVVNRVDLKEFITNLYVDNNKIIMTGLLGSLYYGEILEKNNNDYEKELLKFQKDVFNEISNINLGKAVEYEEAMLMSEKINNVLMIDNLINFCGSYYKELSTRIHKFENYVKAIKIINDNLLLKNE